MNTAGFDDSYTESENFGNSLETKKVSSDPLVFFSVKKL